MDFTRAKRLYDNNRHLIGQIKDGDEVIDDIYIVPTNEDLSTEFYREYLTTFDALSAIEPFKNLNIDFDVFAFFNRNMYLSSSILFFERLENLASELKVNL